MSQLLIRGGTVIDGTNAPATPADVRVRDGIIVEIGADLPARGDERVIDASGCYVAPGFIESHTHYDATMWWQPDLDPLPGYGVTTTVMGNCGFSAAPVPQDEAARLEVIKIFSFFEDIPMQPFIKDLPWDWRSWSEYKRSLTAKVKVPANYCAFVGHIPLRLAAMGLDAWQRAATAAEIKIMAAMLDDALRAGAMGLSSNLMDHDGDNRAVPSLHADDAEFGALLDVLQHYPATSLQIIVDTFMHMTAPASMERLAKLCEGRSLRVQWAGVPKLTFQAEISKKLQAQHERFKQEGRDFWTGYSHIPTTSVISINRSLIFAQSNDYVWHEVVLADSEDKKLKLLNDADWRARARHSWDHDAWRHSPFARPHDLHLLNSDNGVGPVDLSLAEYARQIGAHPSDAMADWFLKNGLQSTVHLAPFPMDEELVLRLLKDSHSVGNISDAGAHGQMLCGGGENMLLFTRYVREGLLSVEEAVHIQTGKLAKFFNLHDRGELKVGKRADIAVFNIDEVERRPLQKIFDVPDGNGGKMWRWTRAAAPMRLTLVNGVPTFEGGRFTGAMPGTMLEPMPV